MKEIEGYSVEKIIQLAEEAYKKVNQLCSEKRAGAYLCLREKSTGKILFVHEIGTCPVEKFPRYFALSVEKGARLFENAHRHVSSWQSRNPDKDQKGGAIITNKLILSMSGLTEHGDEAALLYIAVRSTWLTESDARMIANVSGNEIFKQMRF